MQGNDIEMVGMRSKNARARVIPLVITSIHYVISGAQRGKQSRIQYRTMENDILNIGPKIQKELC
jgi:hypothetical protein